jgi:MFS family permease
MERTAMQIATDGPFEIRRPLDALNFFLADVRDGLGPYLAIYLLTVQRWDEASIGLVMSVATLAGLLAQTPAGALIDATRAKRAVVISAALAVTLASLLLPWLPTFWPVALSQATAHAAAAIFAPAVAAITLGVVGHKAFASRIGRNESFNHAGNAFAAAAAGIAAYVWGPVVVFFVLAAMSVASLVSVLAVPARAINYDLARGLHDETPARRPESKDRDQPSGLKVLITCRPLLIFAACAVLFHFANAAMLPLVGQKLALQDKNSGTSLMELGHIDAETLGKLFPRLAHGQLGIVIGEIASAARDGGANIPSFSSTSANLRGDLESPTTADLMRDRRPH